jgi:hypothetical protein
MNYMEHYCADTYGEYTAGQAARMQALWVEWRQASALPEPTRTSSTRWRLTSYPDFASTRSRVWYIEELEFYSNANCTVKVATTSGTPIDLNTPSPSFLASFAFDGDTDTGWATRGPYTIGYDFGTAVTVMCIKINHARSKFVTQVGVEALDESGNYREVLVKTGLVQGVNNIVLPGQAAATISPTNPAQDLATPACGKKNKGCKKVDCCAKLQCVKNKCHKSRKKKEKMQG